jgi:hypothetical protein
MWRLWFGLALYACFQLAVDYILLTDDLVYDAFINQLSYQRITEIINQSQKWRWFIYFLFPLYLLLKILFITCTFSIGTFFSNGEISFKRLLSVVITSEYIFFIPFFIKLIWFIFFQPNYTLEDIKYFYPLSILSLLDQQEIANWLVYPLQLLNFFELVYWCILAYQLKKILHRDFVGSLGFVASTYVLGLLLWVILVMFLTVSFT